MRQSNILNNDLYFDYLQSKSNHVIMSLVDILKFDHTNYSRKHRRLKIRELRGRDIYSYRGRTNMNELFIDSDSIEKHSHQHQFTMQLEQVFLLFALVSIIASGVYIVLA